MHLDTYVNISVGPANKLSFILAIFTGAFSILEHLTVDNIYVWTFRILSAISVVLIIYINFNKALEIHRAKKQKKNGV